MVLEIPTGDFQSWKYTEWKLVVQKVFTVNVPPQATCCLPNEGAVNEYINVRGCAARPAFTINNFN